MLSKSDYRNSPENGWYALSAAIIDQAIKDYKHYRKVLKRDPGNRLAIAQLVQLRRFFRGSLFSAISQFDPEALIKALNEKYK